MATGGGVHTVTATVTKGIEFFSPFPCHCRHSVNKPLKEKFYFGTAIATERRITKRETEGEGVSSSCV